MSHSGSYGGRMESTWEIAMSECEEGRNQFFEVEDRVRIRNAKSGEWQMATVRSVFAESGKEVFPGEFEVIPHYEVAVEGSSGTRRCSAAELWWPELGDRVRVWDEERREWRLGAVRAWILAPRHAPQPPELFEVLHDGETERREYLGEQLLPLE